MVDSLTPASRTSRRRDASGRTVDDVHSRLNATRVRGVARPTSAESVARLVRRAAADDRPVSVAGGRHAMGGQAFRAGELLVDTRGLDRVRRLDADAGTIEVEAGVQWQALIGATRALSPADRPLAIVQKQTGADDMTLGGSLAANAHGRGLALPPLSAQVEALELVDPDGEIVRASRTERPELFALVLGGYGLFGVVTAVTLRLDPRRRLVRRVRLAETEELPVAFAERMADGALYGDFQFAIDASTDTFLRRGILSTYAPTDEAPRPDQRMLAPDAWRELLYLAHADKTRAFELYAAHYLATDGQVYDSDLHQLASYEEGYHSHVDGRLGGGASGSEMITELYVPHARFGAFLADLRAELRSSRADVVYGTVRLIERDEDTFLAWAREPWICTVLNLHVDHDPAGIAAARARFRALIDVALAHEGSYYLTYHRWASAAQTRAAHPRIDAFLAEKRRLDPGLRLTSDWHTHLARTLA